ncbi:MAG: hypothetical protein PVJ09_04195 [Candidatus Woesebacteria bacterium]|jgi:hypothetical protein
MQSVKNLTKIEILILVFIVILGIFIRLIPGKGHFIWDYDQARDSFEIRKIIQNKDLILIGPQAEKHGMFHGPLYYYYLAPFYYLSHGDQNLPLLAMIFLNLSSIIPLALLSKQLFSKLGSKQSKLITFLVIFLFVISYEQVEYARWLSNVSITIPLLAWSYYFIWKLFSSRKYAFYLGLSLGLAIQGEIFLIYLIAYSYLLLLLNRHKIKDWIKFHFGLAVGLLPLILAELKFNFQSTKTFINYFINRHSVEDLSAGQSILSYLDHMGFTVKNNLSGFSNSFGLYFLILILILYLFWKRDITKLKIKKEIAYIFIWLFSHFILFSFHFVDAVFLNLGIGLSMIFLMSFLIYLFCYKKQKIMASLFLIFVVFMQIRLLMVNTHHNQPFNKFKFVQKDAILFKEKIAIVDQIYQLANNESFTFAVLGTPYGVRTKWASVFEQYARQNDVEIPHWFGYYANGYPGEKLFITQDFPEQKHIVLIESSQHLIDPYTRKNYLIEQDRTTRLIEEKELYGHRIQLRERKE